MNICEPSPRPRSSKPFAHSWTTLKHCKSAWLWYRRTLVRCAFYITTWKYGILYNIFSGSWILYCTQRCRGISVRSYKVIVVKSLGKSARVPRTLHTDIEKNIWWYRVEFEFPVWVAHVRYEAGSILNAALHKFEAGRIGIAVIVPCSGSTILTKTQKI